MIKNASRTLKIGVHSPFDPKFHLGFGTFLPRKILAVVMFRVLRGYWLFIQSHGFMSDASYFFVENKASVGVCPHTQWPIKRVYFYTSLKKVMSHLHIIIMIRSFRRMVMTAFRRRKY